MTGRPRYHAAQVELENRAREMRADGIDDATELDYVCEWVRNGGTVQRLAEDISTYTPVDVWRSQIMRYRQKTFGVQVVAERLADARPQGAHAIAEDAVAVVDKLDAREGLLSREDIAKAKLQADMRTWLAEKWNPREFGERQGSQVTGPKQLDRPAEGVRGSGTKTARD